MSANALNKTKIIGIGTSGSKVLDLLIEQGLTDVDLIAIDTYADALTKSRANLQLCIGSDFLHGGGSGGDPRVGQKAAEMSATEIRDLLSGADQVLIVCGLGGGTGGGASSIIAHLARECGAITIGVVSNPFGFEGTYRQRIAASAVEKLNSSVDMLVILSQGQIFRYMPASKTPQLDQIFATATKVMAQEISSHL